MTERPMTPEEAPQQLVKYHVRNAKLLLDLVNDIVTQPGVHACLSNELCLQVWRVMAFAHVYDDLP